jgi:hypothetical protein
MINAYRTDSPTLFPPRLYPQKAPAVPKRIMPTRRKINSMLIKITPGGQKMEE